MATLAASPPANIGFTCTDEELFIPFDKLTSGSPLPSNVMDVNPYYYEPQNLPDDVWFLIRSEENVDMEHSFWKTKEKASEVFSNSDIIGWKTTLEYYEAHEHKTDWVMQVFSITQKRLCNENEKKETSSLCRVFLVSSHEMQQNMSSAGIENETRNNLTQHPALYANSSRRICSLSNPEVNKHDETEVLASVERLPVPRPEHQGENLVEMDFFSRGFFSGGDFLELRDLDNPASSSSSENSSAMSIASDECFDSMAFLQDLEDQILEQNDAGKKLNVSASNKSDEVVIVPATLAGSLVSVEGSNSGSDEFFKTTSSMPNSASGSRNQNKKVTKHAKGDQRGEGPSSSSRKPSTSSDSDTEAPGGKKRAAFGGMKNLRKYLCFMAF